MKCDKCGKEKIKFELKRLEQGRDPNDDAYKHVAEKPTGEELFYCADCDKPE